MQRLKPDETLGQSKRPIILIHMFRLHEKEILCIRQSHMNVWVFRKVFAEENHSYCMSEAILVDDVNSDPIL